MSLLLSLRSNSCDHREWPKAGASIAAFDDCLSIQRGESGEKGLEVAHPI